MKLIINLLEFMMICIVFLILIEPVKSDIEIEDENSIVLRKGLETMIDGKTIKKHLEKSLNCDSSYKMSVSIENNATVTYACRLIHWKHINLSGKAIIESYTNTAGNLLFKWNDKGGFGVAVLNGTPQEMAHGFEKGWRRELQLFNDNPDYLYPIFPKPFDSISMGSNGTLGSVGYTTFEFAAVHLSRKIAREKISSLSKRLNSYNYDSYVASKNARERDEESLKNSILELEKAEQYLKLLYPPEKKRRAEISENIKEAIPQISELCLIDMQRRDELLRKYDIYRELMEKPDNAEFNYILRFNIDTSNENLKFEVVGETLAVRDGVNEKIYAIIRNSSDLENIFRDGLRKPGAIDLVELVDSNLPEA